MLMYNMSILSFYQNKMQKSRVTRYIFFKTVVVFSHRRNHSRFLAYWYVCYVNKAFIYT